MTRTFHDFSTKYRDYSAPLNDVCEAGGPGTAERLALLTGVKSGYLSRWRRGIMVHPKFHATLDAAIEAVWQDIGPVRRGAHHAKGAPHAANGRGATPFDAAEEARSAKAASAPPEPPLSFVILSSFDELRALPDAQPEMVVAPWLPLSGLAMVYAWRGTGKSQFILGLAISIATGTDFLKWHVPKARSVAYIDGELPVADLLSRFDRLIAPSGIKPAEGQLRLLSMRHPGQCNQLNLADRRHHAPFLAAIGDAEVVILDSTVSLWDGKEADAWPVVKAFLKQLMRLRKTMIFLHQAGKSGEQRGLSDYEDLPHTVIQLLALPKRPDGIGFRVIEAAPFSWSGEGLGYFGSAVTSSCAAS